MQKQCFLGSIAPFQTHELQGFKYAPPLPFHPNPQTEKGDHPLSELKHAHYIGTALAIKATIPCNPHPESPHVLYHPRYPHEL